MAAIATWVRDTLRLDPAPDYETQRALDVACETVEDTKVKREQLARVWETLLEEGEE